MSLIEISGVTISGTCVGTYDPSNYITSPNYPQNYGHNIDCRWSISYLGPKNLTLKFLDFKTRSSHTLNVYDGHNIHGKPLNAYSGSASSPIVSSGHNMYLRFTSDSSTFPSDSSTTYRGFKIDVSGKNYYGMIYITYIALYFENTKMIYLLIFHTFEFSH